MVVNLGHVHTRLGRVTDTPAQISEPYLSLYYVQHDAAPSNGSIGILWELWRRFVTYQVFPSLH